MAQTLEFVGKAGQKLYDLLSSQSCRNQDTKAQDLAACNGLVLEIITEARLAAKRDLLTEIEEVKATAKGWLAQRRLNKSKESEEPDDEPDPEGE